MHVRVASTVFKGTYLSEAEKAAQAKRKKEVLENTVYKNKFEKKDGSEDSDWDKAGYVANASGVVASTVEMGTELIRKGANYTDDIAKIGSTSSVTGKLLGGIGVGLTFMDGMTSEKGWQGHHTADIVIGSAQIIFLGSGPVGWGVGLLYLGADLTTKGITGKSITENIFD